MTRTAIGCALVCGMFTHTPHSYGGAGMSLVALSLAFASTEASTPEVLLALTAVGLDAEALAAAGLDGASVAAMLATLRGESESVIEANAAVRSWRDAESAARLLQEQVSNTGNTPELANQIQIAQSSVDSTRQAWLTKRSAFLEVVEAAVASAADTSSAQTVITLSNNAERPAPVAYRVITLTDDQWIELRSALSDQAAGAQPSEAGVALLASIDNSPAFRAAQSALLANHAHVSEVIATALLQSISQSE